MMTANELLNPRPQTPNIRTPNMGCACHVTTNHKMSAQQRLLAWCKQQTDGYEGVNIANFHTSWKDGLAFCALVHSLSSGLFEYSSLSADNPQRNLDLAFDLAAKNLGIPKLLDAEDIATTKPEQFSVMTYLGQFYKKYGGTTLRPMLKRTNTSPVLMSEEKKKELDRLASVKERYANKRIEDTTEEDTDSSSEKKTPSHHRPLARTMSERPSDGTKRGSGIRGLPRRDSGLIQKCHISGEIIKGVKPVEWNGNIYHPDHFLCTTCKAKFTKNIVNVNGEPYCEKCGKKAFIRSKIKKDVGASPGSDKKKDIRDAFEQEEQEKMKAQAEQSKKEQEQEKDNDELTRSTSTQKSTMPAWRLKLLERKAQLGSDKSVSAPTPATEAPKETPKEEPPKSEPPKKETPTRPTSEVPETKTEAPPRPATKVLKVETPAPEAKPVPNVTFCARCGTENANTCRFCQECGAKMGVDSPAPARPETKPELVVESPKTSSTPLSTTTEKVESAAEATDTVVKSPSNIPVWKQRLLERKNTQQAGDMKAKVDEAKAKLEADAKAKAEEKAKSEAEAKAKEEAEAKVKAEAEAKTKAEAEAKSKIEAEAKANAEADAKAKAEAEAKAKAEAEANKAAEETRLKAEAEAKAKLEADAKAKAEEKAKSEAEAKAKAKAEAAKAEAEAKAKAKAKAEEEARLKAEAEARVKAKVEAKTKADAEAKVKAEAEAKAKAEAEAKAKAAEEARLKAEGEAKAKIEAEEKARVEAEAQAKAVLAAKAEEEARLKVEAESAAKAKAEARMREEAETLGRAEIFEAQHALRAEKETRQKVEIENEDLRNELQRLKDQIAALTSTFARTQIQLEDKIEEELKATKEEVTELRSRPATQAPATTTTPVSTPAIATPTAVAPSTPVVTYTPTVSAAPTATTPTVSASPAVSPTSTPLTTSPAAYAATTTGKMPLWQQRLLEKKQGGVATPASSTPIDTSVVATVPAIVQPVQIPAPTVTSSTTPVAAGSKKEAVLNLWKQKEQSAKGL